MELLLAAVSAGPGPSDVGLICVVGVGWPEVKGTSVPGEAVKPGAPVVASGAARLVLLGLRTLVGVSIVWKEEG